MHSRRVQILKKVKNKRCTTPKCNSGNLSSNLEQPNQANEFNVILRNRRDTLGNVLSLHKLFCDLKKKYCFQELTFQQSIFAYSSGLTRIRKNERQQFAAIMPGRKIWKIGFDFCRCEVKLGGGRFVATGNNKSSVVPTMNWNKNKIKDQWPPKFKNLLALNIKMVQYHPPVLGMTLNSSVVSWVWR